MPSLVYKASLMDLKGFPISLLPRGPNLRKPALTELLILTREGNKGGSDVYGLG